MGDDERKGLLHWVGFLGTLLFGVLVMLGIAASIVILASTSGGG